MRNPQPEKRGPPGACVSSRHLDSLPERLTHQLDPSLHHVADRIAGEDSPEAGGGAAGQAGGVVAQGEDLGRQVSGVGHRAKEMAILLEGPGGDAHQVARGAEGIRDIADFRLRIAD